MDFSLQEFYKKRKNLKNINKKDIEENSVFDVFVSFFELFFLIPYLIHNLPLTDNIKGIIIGCFVGVGFFFYPISYFFKFKSILNCFFKFFNKIKLKKLNIDNKLKNKIINISPFISNNKINQIIEYYSKLDEIEKDYFLSDYDQEEYSYDFLKTYILKNDINTIKNNKIIISEIIAEDLEKRYLTQIKEIIQEKIEEDEEENKKQIINMFENKKEKRNTILKEI
jgi:hypothetical protein